MNIILILYLVGPLSATFPVLWNTFSIFCCAGATHVQCFVVPWCKSGITRILTLDPTRPQHILLGCLGLALTTLIVLHATQPKWAQHICTNIELRDARKRWWSVADMTLASLVEYLSYGLLCWVECSTFLSAFWPMCLLATRIEMSLWVSAALCSSHQGETDIRPKGASQERYVHIQGLVREPDENPLINPASRQ